MTASIATPNTNLAARISDTRSRLGALRGERAAAVLAGRKFDGAAIDEAERSLSALVDAEAELARRDGEAATADLASRRAGIIGEMEQAETKRIAAVARAETAAREMVAALSEALTTAGTIRRAFSRLGIVAPSWVADTEFSGRLGDRLGTILASMTDRRGHLGRIEFQARRPGGWADGERAEMTRHIDHLKQQELRQ